jgi:DNA-binding transcriptional LysR family regulator
MTLSNLRYFVAAAEEEHFLRASEKLNIAPSALSRRILDLEYRMGVTLFERLPRGVRLTEPGRFFFEKAKKIIADTEMAVSQTRKIHEGVSGALTIGFGERAHRYLIIPKIIKRYREEFPDVELILSPTASAQTFRRLSEGKIDAAFAVRTPQNFDAFEHIKLGRERVLIAMHKSNPLASRQPPCLEDLKNEKFIWTSRELAPEITEIIMEHCLAGGLTPRIVVEAPTEALRLSMVQAGMAITFAWSHSVSLADVCLREVVDLPLYAEMDFIWDRNRVSPALSSMVDMLDSLNNSRMLVDPSQMNIRSGDPEMELL